MESERHSTPPTPNTNASPTQPPFPASPALAPAAIRPRAKHRMLALSVFGLIFLCFLAGAAVMFFQLPTSGVLSKSFMGVRAWAEQSRIVKPHSTSDAPIPAGIIDDPGKTFDGFTLYACASLKSPSTRVYLINMNRDLVHQWSVAFSKIWPNPPHLEGRRIDDSSVSIFACHLYENGDLLVVFHGVELHATGYGLAKIDKDSNVLWSYASNVHHDVTVGDDGVIYTITQRRVNSRPKGMEFIPLPWTVDHLVLLSPDGKELCEPISLLDALAQSPYRPLLGKLETPLSPEEKPALNDDSMNALRQLQNVLHANSVSVLTRALAPKFPGFKPGQALVTLRNINAFAVVDPTTRSVEWAATGPWRMQHDGQFLDNGHLLIFDNVGSPRGSRVLEYDPSTRAFPWIYPGLDKPPFFNPVRGMAQRLPNGNTLIVNSEDKEMFEVTPDKEIVWNCGAHDEIGTARRYAPERVKFLKPGEKPRR
jgi:hypothetical protein